ncbi:probable enoyl-CoA hydratase 2, mitochondrial isoform X1 [Oryza brachyantha]|uniref:probable enoyl-CoA hydratase 2, mitochondrial isoform X1 n=1 Tax=Oryza brachyantha TaxID=4533 RepID=UPI00077686FB|nr:probable enoyl-CoA hydratase 2, mitochondrial isoform X1 [Oryza brachyantha]
MRRVSYVCGCISDVSHRTALSASVCSPSAPPPECAACGASSPPPAAALRRPAPSPAPSGSWRGRSPSVSTSSRNPTAERKLMSSSGVREYANSLRSTFSAFEALPISTIAVIEGAALGGGLELALSCDLRICGEDATLGLPETGLAIIPGAGGTQRLPRIVGRSRAKEIIFTGRRCNASEAVMMGLANYCVPAGEAYEKALELAHEITQKGPLGIRMAKKAIDQGMQAADMPSALAVEGECYEQLLNTEDRLEGLAAFAERRKPVYSGK